ncbi:MAG: hypothetical protein CMH54_09365 [Myxococcales bacterium]|nr:hypothetical protein [Myxococcales bacterium]
MKKNWSPIRTLRSFFGNESDNDNAVAGKSRAYGTSNKTVSVSHTPTDEERFPTAMSVGLQLVSAMERSKRRNGETTTRLSDVRVVQSSVPRQVVRPQSNTNVR